MSLGSLKTTPRVLFATKTYKGDFIYFLQDAFEKKKAACQYPFTSHALALNNGLSEDIKSALQVKVGCVLDVESVIGTLYDHFNLDDQYLGRGKWYALGELATVFYAGMEEYDYICYVQGDCITTNGDWITPAIEILQTNPEVMIVSPQSEVNTWHDEHNLDHYCSDQAFVARVSDLINPLVYQVEGADPDYPQYGGNSFEAMVGKYLKKSGKFRQILPDFWVIHQIFS